MADSRDYDSTAHWYVTDDSVFIRLPWTMINVSDPSSRTVLLDGRRGIAPGPAGIQDSELGGLRTARTEGVRVYAVVTENGAPRHYGPREKDAFMKDPPSYLWDGWEEAAYRQRLKKSHSRIARLYRELESLVPGWSSDTGRLQGVRE